MSKHKRLRPVKTVRLDFEGNEYLATADVHLAKDGVHARRCALLCEGDAFISSGSLEQPPEGDWFPLDDMAHWVATGVLPEREEAEPDPAPVIPTRTVTIFREEWDRMQQQLALLGRLCEVLEVDEGRIEGCVRAWRDVGADLADSKAHHEALIAALGAKTHDGAIQAAMCAAGTLAAYREASDGNGPEWAKMALHLLRQDVASWKAEAERLRAESEGTVAIPREDWERIRQALMRRASLPLSWSSTELALEIDGNLELLQRRMEQYSAVCREIGVARDDHRAVLALAHAGRESIRDLAEAGKVLAVEEGPSVAVAAWRLRDERDTLAIAARHADTRIASLNRALNGTLDDAEALRRHLRAIVAALGLPPETPWADVPGMIEVVQPQQKHLVIGDLKPGDRIHLLEGWGWCGDTIGTCEGSDPTHPDQVWFTWSDGRAYLSANLATDDPDFPWELVSSAEDGGAA